MKVVELRAERVRLGTLICNSQVYFWSSKEDCFNSGTENLNEEDARKAYDSDQKLLKKLDAVNNALFESDAKTYIDVQENHLSVATARKYLGEMSRHDYEDADDWDNIAPLFSNNYEDFGSTSNLRCFILDKSRMPIWVKRENLVDPLKLDERKEEVRQKYLDWCLGLKKAIAISDATTEVTYHE